MPKTAGGTLSAGIRSNPGIQWLHYIKPDQIPLPSNDQIWFGGHLHFGHHLIYDAAPAYYTVLRDPIDRLISEFFYHHQHPNPGVFISDDEIVPAFIRMAEAAPHLNYYSYMFSAYCVDKEAAEQGVAPWNGDPASGFDLIVGRDKRFGYLAENAVFNSFELETAFLRALRNVVSMRFIGFFEYLPEAVKQLDRMFALDVGLDLRMHKTTWKPGLDDLPASVVKMLKRKTEADYELYHRACRAPAAALPRSKRW
jgi:hypothetical protein